MYQKIIIIGHLGSDPEMRYLPNGTPVTAFSVATTRKWTDQQTGQPAEETCWFKVSVWNQQAEACNQYLNKGSKVLVEGMLSPDRATGGPKTFQRRDGTVGATYEIRAEAVRFLNSRSDNGQPTESYTPAGVPRPQDEDDIPF